MNERKLSFEQAITRLDEIVRSLEKGDAMLNEAEQMVVKLKKGPDGEPVERPFDDKE